MVTKDGVRQDPRLRPGQALPSEHGRERRRARRRSRRRRPGTVLGTVGYMSPEQASGKPLDFRSDQFSLGSILYEMATGKRAFQRGTTAETLTAIIREEAGARRRRSTRPFRRRFRWIVERCLAKDPDERYASTRDLAQRRAQHARAPLRGRRRLRRGRARGRGGRAPTRSAAPGCASRPSIAAPRGASRAGMLLQKRFASSAPPSYQQITFGSGTIRSGAVRARTARRSSTARPGTATRSSSS